MAGWAAWSARGSRAGADRAADRAERGVKAQEDMARALDHMADGGPEPPWKIEWVAGHLYRLRNMRLEAAVDVTAFLGEPLAHRDLPDGVTIGALQSVEFTLVASWQQTMPGELMVTEAGSPDPVAVPMPELPPRTT